MRALENADRIREALARLPTASRADLTAEWLRLYGCAPPSKLRRELLMAAISYRFVSDKTDRGRLYRISESRSAGFSPAARICSPRRAASERLAVIGSPRYWLRTSGGRHCRPPRG